MKMVAMTLGYEQATKTSSSVVLAVLLHIMVIGFFIRTIEDTWDDYLPSPSVVMELSFESEAKQLTETNIGKTQELSIASEAKLTPDDEFLEPVVPVNEDAELLVVKIKNKKTQPEVKKAHKEISNKRISEIESDNSKASSAPVTSEAVAKQQTQRVAAQVDSSSQADDSKRQWEAMVLGQLNKFKRYPDDAKRHNRIGRPIIKFEVDAQGYVLDSVLIKNSGTQSLDREAQRVLLRAEPLPPPPIDMLVNGKVTVKLPIDFNIIND